MIFRFSAPRTRSPNNRYHLVRCSSDRVCEFNLRYHCSCHLVANVSRQSSEPRTGLFFSNRTLERMSISIAAVVVLLLLTQLAGSAQAQAKEGSGEGQLQYQLGKIPLFPNSTRIRVCASPWTPAVECTVDSSAPGREQWETASGYEIEVFKQMMPVLGWTDEMIDFKCLGWSEMLDELAANETSCDIAPSGLGPKLDRMEKGIIFSDPTIQSGLSVMMVSQDSMTRWVARFTLSSQLSALSSQPSLTLRSPPRPHARQEHLVLLLRDDLGSLGCAARDRHCGRLRGVAYGSGVEEPDDGHARL